MKLKLPSPGIIPFIIANVLTAIGYYTAGMFFIAYMLVIIFLQLSAQHSMDITPGVIAAVLIEFIIIILGIIYAIIKNFFIYLALKKIEKKGEEKYRVFIQNLKKDYKKQLLIILISVLIDAIIVYFHFADNYYTPTGTYKLATAKEIYIAQLQLYLLGGSLTIGYLITFVIWKIQALIKAKRQTNET